MLKTFLKKLIKNKKNQTFPADHFVVSYPKCGRTWIRVMIIRYLQNHFNLEKNPQILETSELSLVNSSVPILKFTHGVGNPFEETPEELDGELEEFKGKSVMLLVRDPRDVMISSYFHKRYRNVFSSVENYTKSISEFIDEPKGSLDTILEYYNIWFKKKEITDRILLIKYEELMKNTETKLKEILGFIGIKNVDESSIRDAVNFSSFENMQKMEGNDKFQSDILRPADINNVDSFKTRKGKIGGFREYLSQEEEKRINEKIIEKLPRWYGYEIK